MSRRAFLLLALVFLSGSGRAAPPAAEKNPPPLPAALPRAREVLPLIAAAVDASFASAPSPTAPAPAPSPSLGPTLAAYAKNIGADPARFENFAEAARRILASGTTARRAPDATSRWFDETADLLLASSHTAEASTAADLKILAYLSRFHARRIVAAVRYNLFLRGQSLAELYAATLESRAAVEAWRAFTATVGDRAELSLPSGAQTVVLRGAWRDELTRLEFDLKDLEAMCCPPDEDMLRVKIWTPAAP